MPDIHPTALVDPTAEIATSAVVGPHAIVEAGAVVGERTRLFPSAFVGAGCVVGADCELHIGAVVGGAPQMRVMSGPAGRVRVGAHSVLREYVTVHRAVRPDAWTVVGDGAFLMATSHVAHDCVLGHDVTMANGALLAGFVTIGDRSFLSGNTCIHQFTRIGRLAMIAGGARVPKDIPPFSMVAQDGSICGLNVVGMRRAGFSAADRLVVKRAFRTVYRAGLNVTQAVQALQAEQAHPLVDEIVSFVTESRRGVSAWRRRGRGSAVDDVVGE